jgi:hypothetical protein
MKITSQTKLLLLAGVLAFTGALAVAPARADEPVKKERKISKKVLEKYDLNHNGVLDPEEEAAWKADREKARAERKKKKEEGAIKEDVPKAEAVPDHPN